MFRVVFFLPWFYLTVRVFCIYSWYEGWESYTKKTPICIKLRMCYFKIKIKVKFGRWLERQTGLPCKASNEGNGRIYMNLAWSFFPPRSFSVPCFLENPDCPLRRFMTWHNAVWNATGCRKSWCFLPHVPPCLLLWPFPYLWRTKPIRNSYSNQYKCVLH